MATIFSHSLVALCATAGLHYRTPALFYLVAALSSIAPDADVLGFRFGIAYADPLGHRGLSHSLIFAFLWSLLCMELLFRRSLPLNTPAGGLHFFLLFACVASHGLLDGLTDGGLGVAYFAPFDDTRYFLPWRPIAVSPIGAGAFFSERGARVIQNELLRIWTGAISLLALSVAIRLVARRLQKN